MKRAFYLILVFGWMGCNLFAAQERRVISSKTDSELADSRSLDLGTTETGIIDTSNFDSGNNLDSGTVDMDLDLGPTDLGNDANTGLDLGRPMAAPFLTSAVRSGQNYILTFEQPAGTLAPDGGYDTYINGVDQNDNTQHSGFTRAIIGLSIAMEQCFFLESRYTVDSVFPRSNEICVP